MKKTLSVLSIMALILLSGCSKEEVLEIGILQPVEHIALGEAREGFIDGLEEAGFAEEDIKINYQNALGSDSDLKSMASSIVRDADLVLGIGTGAAQSIVSAAANAGKDIPLMFTAVTDPVGAGLVDSLETPGANVTGTSDLNPVKEQVSLVKDFLPDATTFGIVYTASEQNSEVQANLAKEAAEEMGLEVVVKTINTASDITMTIRSLAKEVDAIYIPTDNTLASNMPTIAQICIEEGVFTITGESGPVELGGAASLSIDYYELGKLTGKMAADILNGEEVSTYSVGFLPKESYKFVTNEETLSALGLE